MSFRSTVVIASVLCLAGAGSLLAEPKPETSALLSKGCDPEKLRELAGGAILDVQPMAEAGEGIYRVTLDTEKLTFGDLAARMQPAGCFEEKPATGD